MLATTVAEARLLVSSLISCPDPTGPRWATRRAKLLKTGRAISSASLVPPTITVIVPAFAPLWPPLTGASRTCTPRARAALSSPITVSGSSVECIARDRTSVVQGQSVAVRGELGGPRLLTNNTHEHNTKPKHVSYKHS